MTPDLHTNNKTPAHINGDWDTYCELDAKIHADEIEQLEQRLDRIALELSMATGEHMLNLHEQFAATKQQLHALLARQQ